VTRRHRRGRALGLLAPHCGVVVTPNARVAARRDGRESSNTMRNLGWCAGVGTRERVARTGWSWPTTISFVVAGQPDSNELPHAKSG
jgi:hypothetical protein